MNKDKIILAVILFVMVIIVMLIGILILSKMNVDIEEYYQKTCDEVNGYLVAYSGCSCDGFFVKCECEKEGGVYCKLNNGTEVDITIRDAVS